MLGPDRQAEAFACHFGENLIYLREAAGLSQDELAYLSGMHRTEVSQLEQGLRVPRVDTVVKLCASLEAGYSELLDGITWRPPPPRRGLEAWR
jgi:transcriptional regulator with XRE-family HTH domain